MDRICIWVLPFFIFLILPMSNSEADSVKQSLLQFMAKLSAGNQLNDQNWGWNMSSDPCGGTWEGVDCKGTERVRIIVLDRFNFTGTIDASSVCKATSLFVLSLKENSISGSLPNEIGNCKRLTHLYISGNRFTGNIPATISQLRHLKRLDISNNEFSGELPGVSQMSELITFLAENNQLSGAIPDLHFSNLEEFNASTNNFSGPIPDVKGKFGADSFSGNLELCGNPLPNACPPSSSSLSGKNSKHSSLDRIFIYSGYMILGLVLLLLVALKLVKRKKGKKTEAAKNSVTAKDSNENTGSISSEVKTSANRSEYSIKSVEAGMNSSSLVVLDNPVAKGLKFEELLRAPAELLGRGKHGTLYKVLLDNGANLVVKRIKDSGMSKADFKKRVQKIDQVKHSRVLPLVALYCSKQEKLLVYEYQPNGNLFNFLHDKSIIFYLFRVCPNVIEKNSMSDKNTNNDNNIEGSRDGQGFEWESRLNVAASIAESLAFMHEQLHESAIAHGNLKSTNILFNKNMEPCISEYGLMVVQEQDQSILSQSESFKSITTSDGIGAYSSTFKVDVYSFGVILLELLTGKLVQNNGFDLAKWVHSVVREEWTAEVFDRDLISESASEERMVNMLQVALKCINPSPNERPSMAQVSAMINIIKEDEERSIVSDP